MRVKLHATRAGAGPPVVLLHGLFGSGNNLGAVARSLQNRFAVACVDLPNHGRSDWLSPAGLDDMAECLREWLLHHGLGSASFLGHSLGGKVAMQLALRYPALVTTLIVADIAPVAYPSHHDQVFEALAAVAAGRCESRQQAARVMGDHVEEADVIQFLLSSLHRNEEGTYSWRFNLDGLKRDYAAVREAPVSSAPYPGNVLFIKGGESSYILPEHRGRILSLFPHASVKVMPACGHWLHAQQPRLFNSIVGRFLDRRAGSGTAA